MSAVKVTVFGSSEPLPVTVCGCKAGCCASGSMPGDAEDLRKHLEEKYGEAVRFDYVDVKSEEFKKHPEIAALLEKVCLPVTALNGEPKFYGGMSITTIAGAVGKMLEEK